MIKFFELLSFVVSATVFGYGAFHLFRDGIPRFFRLYVCAAGCYMLEELWVVVNSLLGNGSQDGLVTVRLFGFFGCLCFMLSSNANEFDKTVDERTDRRIMLPAFIAPAFLLILYALYAFSPIGIESPGKKIIGFLAISPALFASYFSLKHLLLPEDSMGFLRTTRALNTAALVFYAANYIYPLLYLHFPGIFMSIYDLVLAGILLVIIILCRRGALKWKTLI